MATSQSYLNLIQFPLIFSSIDSSPFLLFSELSNSSTTVRSSSICHHISFQRRNNSSIFPITVRSSSPTVRCFTKSTDENWSNGETIQDHEWRDDNKVEQQSNNNTNNNNYNNSADDVSVDHQEATNTSLSNSLKFSSDSLSLGIREPVYEVVEVKSDGVLSTKKINRRQLLKSSGLRPRDVRSVDPSLWMTNSMPSLLVREHAILLNLGSLRAIAMHERVLIFDYNRKGGKAFLDHLMPRLNPKNVNGGPSMPFELEVVEAALVSRIQRLERKLMDVEPRVVKLLEVLPNRLTADILEQLRLSKQTLVELGSRAGALKQMLLDLLEDPHEIRRMCIMGRNCTIKKGSSDMECSVPVEKQVAEEEEEEIEMLLENYLQRLCESCHAQAERLLDSAREMEDSIAVNLSSRRLEVSKVELLLQVGTFCVAIGALVAGIFGMNLKSYLEEHVQDLAHVSSCTKVSNMLLVVLTCVMHFLAQFAFWLTTAGDAYNNHIYKLCLDHLTSSQTIPKCTAKVASGEERRRDDIELGKKPQMLPPYEVGILASTTTEPVGVRHQMLVEYMYQSMYDVPNMWFL
ncbi:Magnesium transporter MRS2/LPE10 [Macleaya cordata]|uniref:Magnesium transporter n=1 Tax=Macleaya cordata TaxID=56857 RepID=A0A200R596_MACCD|nr:Magnesium transporter MRS2/LPE10 [Macleaya cordata]